MGDVVIRFVGGRRRIIDHLLTVQAHTNLPLWEHDPIRRDAVAFRLILVARLVRDVDRPTDVSEADFAWARGLARFGATTSPDPDEFRRVVDDELPGILARLEASIA